MTGKEVGRETSRVGTETLFNIFAIPGFQNPNFNEIIRKTCEINFRSETHSS